MKVSCHHDSSFRHSRIDGDRDLSFRDMATGQTSAFAGQLPTKDVRNERSLGDILTQKPLLEVLRVCVAWTSVPASLSFISSCSMSSSDRMNS